MTHCQRQGLLAVMLIVIVDVQVRLGTELEFEAASLENATHSIQEPGIARFDVLRDRDDPQHFQLVEVYRTDDAPAAHKETAHYQKWRETVEPMMARPRSSTKLDNVFPSDEGW